MLSSEQLKQIPRTTRNNWNSFTHENYDGHEMAEAYIEDFNQIKDVLVSKHLKRAMKAMCTMRAGYKELVAKVDNSKQLLKENAQDLLYSVKRLKVQSGTTFQKTCKILGISIAWYYRQRSKAKCSLSALGKCFRQHPRQLTFEEIGTIETIVKENMNSGKTKTTLYYESLRARLISCGKTTFFKYLNLFGYQTPKNTKHKKHYKGYKAKRPFEALHVDVTLVPTLDDGTQRTVFVKDNFSKSILHHASTSGSVNSEFIKDLLKTTFEKHQLFDHTHPINIVSDGGSENKGKVIHWVNGIKAPPVVRKIIAQTDEFPFSNSASEYLHRIYKSEYMQNKLSKNETEHLQNINDFVDYYNYHRFPSDFYGLAPMEVLNGKIVDKHRFKEAIQTANRLRVEANKAFNDCPIICI